MATKLILSTVAATALMCSVASAQVHTTDGDPRFAPRTYGSTAITGVDYGQGATRTYIAPTHVQAQPVVTHSQSGNRVRVVEPVTQDFQTTISAPITYSDTGVVRAQHFKQGDLSHAEYQALLQEADRVRAYQITNENYAGSSYGNSYGTAQSASETTSSYEIELFAPETIIEDSVIYAETTPITSFSTSPVTSSSHTVIKGDTLYNISRRYAVTLNDLQNANNLSDNNIGLGQVLTIPSSTTFVSEAGYLAPITMASTATRAPVTLVRNVEPIPGQNSGIYAVLPKDTLYSISKSACVKVADLIAVNGNINPQTIQPGQRLTMPAGHCLN